ncbi:MAG TPA: hypothetical protein VH722_15725 [Alphaproteobacteria bacterium]|jgi:hypothetical protein|nr:hypothetical protein [Alphaproteobacteria bacterium]
MDEATHSDREAERRKPSPFVAELAERQQAIVQGAAPWNDPVEQRRADRRRDMEILRLASMESAIHITEYIAGRLPNWKKEAIEKIGNPVAALANLNRSIIQITLAEDRFDETGEERLARIKAEAEAEARARNEAEAARAYTDAQIRRAENKRQVKGLIRAVSLSSIRLPFDQQQKLLDDLFRELETEDAAVSAYNGDPAETAADLFLRLGFGPKDVTTKQILERRAALVEAARAHIEGLRGPPEAAADAADPDGAVVSFAQAKAQGPPN